MIEGGAVWIGLGLNLVATVGGVVAVLLKYENRMTKIETHLVHLLQVSNVRK